jgi:tRNA(Ile)-lysidine synthase
MSLADRVGRFVRDHDLARSGTRVIAAVSGGADSTALAHLLRALDTAGALQLAGMAHFNHQLRTTAPDDEQFCEQLGRVLGLRLIVEREDVRRRASAGKQSIEAAAHGARYAFFERARAELNADVVALGHSRDDQAETFLLRLLRGAGARGLAAMHPRNGVVIRPLLDCRRAELRTYLAARGLPFREDESNADIGVPRNRVRAELLPVLESRFNPAVVDALANEADIARAEWEWLQSAADDLWPRACRHDGDRWQLDGGTLREAPLALTRLVVRRAMAGASHGRPISFAHSEHAIRLLWEDSGPIAAPGQSVDRVDGNIVLTSRREEGRRRSAAKGKSSANLFAYPLSIPGEVHSAEAGWIVSAEPASSWDQARAVLSTTAPSSSAVVPLSMCEAPLVVRSRQTGDRFRPLGLNGRKKLQDYFVDRKIPRLERDRVPLVVDRSGRIIWVGGHGIDEAFRVTDPAQAVLVLKLMKVAGGLA